MCFTNPQKIIEIDIGRKSGREIERERERVWEREQIEASI